MNNYHLIGFRVAVVEVVQLLGDPLLLDIGALSHHLLWRTSTQVLQGLDQNGHILGLGKVQCVAKSKDQDNSKANQTNRSHFHK